MEREKRKRIKIEKREDKWHHMIGSMGLQKLDAGTSTQVSL